MQYRLANSLASNLLRSTEGYAKGERGSEERHVQIYEAQDRAIASRNAATPDIVRSPYFYNEINTQPLSSRIFMPIICIS
ncbi:unnamed protein product [Lasius platythorax]|uniref:Uncharacterized protein n=1 Tax=Lasius platythorax TaxID=488582 RepID=A0AAV2NQX4_9HYME